MPDNYNKEKPYVVAIIPVRGGSKRIPDKNLALLAGRPLLAHSIIHAKNSRLVREVYVTTDSDALAALAHDRGAEVIRRPTELASDSATSEASLLHVLDERNRKGLTDPDLVVFLQATSPVRASNDIDRAIETLIANSLDSVFSACRSSRLLWCIKNEQPVSINYDFQRRQREQDMPRQYRENGSIYVFRPEVIRKNNNRLGGRIGIYEMGYWSSFQVDSHEHIELIDWIMRQPGYLPLVDWPDPIALVVFDFDGVMTDNTVYVDQHCGETVHCSRADGWGIARLNDAGVPMIVLSTEENPVVAARCLKLKLPFVQGCGNKSSVLSGIIKERGIAPENVIYIGNDVNDLDCLRSVGMPVAVGDAYPEVVSECKLILTKPGGRGAIREFSDLLLAQLARRKDPLS